MEKRIHPFTNQPQYLIPSLMAHLKKIQRKRHNRQELFTIVVTMVDIYPSPEWNFVYGEASPDEGIGIYSFARLDPLFPHSSPETLQQPCTKEEQVLILKRAVSTYVHEVMHLFGLKHCIYYLCLMNGTNCESEMDGQLLYLCPVCLKKMYLLFGQQHYDIIKIYQGLLKLSKKVGFEEEAKWYENRLRIINTD
jgi:archaemetzincin